MLHTNVADWAAFKLYEAIMAFYILLLKKLSFTMHKLWLGPGAINLLFMLNEWVGWIGKRK